MKICAVQCRSKAGEVTANLQRHQRFIRHAADLGGDLVVFPELSLTGYEPRLAKSLAMDDQDLRFNVLEECSRTRKIIIGVGLPLAKSAGIAESVQIGMIWFTPEGPRQIYAKQILHDDERPYFMPGDSQILLDVGGFSMAPAICFESLQFDHAAAVSQSGANVYLASVAKPQRGIDKAVLHYPAIARRHKMAVIMANSVGPSDNFLGAGQSGAWNDQGHLVAQMDSDSEGIVIYDAITGSADIWIAPQNL